METSPTPQADRITTRFGFDTTAMEVLEGVDLSGKRAVVTGGASGIGTETTAALAAAGAEVTVAVRDTTAAEPVVAAVRERIGSGAGSIAIAELDLVDVASIDSFAAAWDSPLHMLVNNAGVMAVPERRLTPAGWELQFATNHLGHFRLALGLHGALAAAPGGARVVSVSSSGHMIGPVDFEDPHFARREYDPWKGYGQAKTANVLFAVEAARRWAADGIVANALMPGGIITRLQRYTPQLDEVPGVTKSAAQGAATSVLLAASPEVEGVTGRYFSDCNEGFLHEPPFPQYDRADVEAARQHMRWIAPWAVDADAAARLWDMSLEQFAAAGH